MRRTQRDLCIAGGSNHSRIIFPLRPFWIHFSSFLCRAAYFFSVFKKGGAAILRLTSISRPWGDGKRCYRLERHIHSIGDVKIAYFSFLFSFEGEAYTERIKRKWNFSDSKERIEHLLRLLQYALTNISRRAQSILCGWAQEKASLPSRPRPSASFGVIASNHRAITF